VGCRSDIVDGVVMAAFGVVMVRGWLRLCGLVVAVGLVGVWVVAVMVVRATGGALVEALFASAVVVLFVLVVGVAGSIGWSN
jgi:hypothetical protein